MTKLAHILIAILFTAVAAESQQSRCMQADFSGEATQEQVFRQEIGEHLSISVWPIPPGSREKTVWRWFQIKVIPDGGLFVFNPSDGNWLLATDWNSPIIGGANTTDVKRAMEYRTRYMIFPMSTEDKQQLLEIARALKGSDQEEQHKGLAALQSMRLGQMKFEITDYRLGEQEPPVAVDSVKFKVTVILPPDFLVSGKLGVSFVDCPRIPTEVMENIQDPKRHEYFLPKTSDSTER